MPFGEALPCVVRQQPVMPVFRCLHAQERLQQAVHVGRLEQVFAAVLMLTVLGVTLSTAVVVAERLFSWRLDQPVSAS